MPRKRSPDGKPTDAAGTELRAVRCELTPQETVSSGSTAKRDQSMASLVRTLILDFLSKKKK